MKKIILPFILALVVCSCNKQTVPESTMLYDNDSVICGCVVLTDSSIFLPTFNHFGDSVIEYNGKDTKISVLYCDYDQVEVVQRAEAVYIKSKKLLSNVAINLWYNSDCIYKEYFGGVWENNNNVGLVFLNKDEAGNYVYFVPYSKFQLGHYEYFDHAVILYWEEGLSVDDNQFNEITIYKNDFSKYIDTFAARLIK